ncbi:MAG: hypothetical protein R3240_10080 [Gammaproteobacteria bacterium]|nr:hypothetical protein [Gammaproteobacteria bacterium]
MAISGLQSSLAGIHQGFQGLRQNAQAIASNSVEDSPLSKENTESMVGLLTNSHQVEVNAKALKVQNDTLGTLLDELA